MFETDVYQLRKEKIDGYLETYLKTLFWQHEVGPMPKLFEAVSYSLLGPGKRFRPVLGLVLAEDLGLAPNQVLPWLAAIEMVHTYSLIHDDLPCMDDDDHRRGRPTNHRIFGEGVALLAGDALLTEAFSLLSKEYLELPRGMALVQILSQAAGLTGMVLGQADDIASAEIKVTGLEDVLRIHQQKTASLIGAAVTGVGVVAGLPRAKINLIQDFGLNVGLAFQVKDDLLDQSEVDPEGLSCVPIAGAEFTEKLLFDFGTKAQASLDKLNISTDSLLRKLVQYNFERIH